MKVKLFVFSDVHGEVEALVQGLREAGYDASNPSHKLVCIGDLFDRGPGSKKLFDIMVKGQNIWVKGNHEIMLEEALEKGMDGEFVFFNMLHNGLDKTISSFSDYNLDGLVSMEQLELAIKRARTHTRGGKTVLSVLKTLPLYYETKNYIFVHAGLDPYVYDWKLTPEDFMTWDIEASCLPIESTRKTVIIGHHHAFRVRAQGEEKGCKQKEIDMLISNHKIAKMLDDIIAMGCNPKDTATWILTDCAGVLRKDGKTLNDLTMTAETLATIIKMVDSGEINRNAGKKILIAVVEEGVDPIAYCKENGFLL